jgi:hypothetical protein
MGSCCDKPSPQPEIPPIPNQKAALSQVESLKKPTDKNPERNPEKLNKMRNELYNPNLTSFQPPNPANENKKTHGNFEQEKHKYKPPTYY